MNRRDAVMTLAAAGLTVMAGIPRAQSRMVHIGVLGNLEKEASPTFPFTVKRLAELGYVEGKNTIIDYRTSRGNSERVPALARELLKRNVDLIIVMGPLLPVRALLAEKATLPIVFCAIDYEPLEAGIVASYHRPGANVTGAYIAQPALAVKRLELARELMPGLKRVLVCYDAFCSDQLAAVEQAAAREAVQVEAVEFKAPPYDYAAAFAQGRRSGAQAFVGLMSPIFFQDSARMSVLAVSQRLPAVGASNAFAQAGFLASYGASLEKIAARAGEIAARILRGAKPAETPVEQINEFEFAVNLKTAKALGMKVPQAILLRADKVIE